MANLDETVARLIARTQEGRLNWDESYDPDQFITSVGAISVRISSHQGVFSRAHTLDILDHGGRVVESVSDGSEPANVESLLGQLFELARRSALDIDSVLDQLNRALGP